MKKMDYARKNRWLQQYMYHILLYQVSSDMNWLHVKI